MELRCHNARDAGEVEHSGAVSAFSRVLSAASGGLSLPVSNFDSSPQRVASKSFEKIDSNDECKTFRAVRLVVDDLSLPLATKTGVRPVLEFLRHLMETGDQLRYGRDRYMMILNDTHIT